MAKHIRDNDPSRISMDQSGKKRQNHALASLVKIIIKRNFLFQIKPEQL